MGFKFVVMKVDKINTKLVDDLIALIEESRQKVAYAANAAMTLTYWHVGKRINEDIVPWPRQSLGSSD